jgi:hypothetical protein
MRPSFSQVLAIVLASCSAVALLHVSIALGANRPFGDSPRTTQTVRSYYASVNRFLASEDGNEPLPLFPGSSRGPDPENDSSIWCAIRSTYPNLQLEPGDVSGSSGLAISPVAAINGGSALPAWINNGIGPPFPNSVDSLRIEDGAVVERLSTARIGVLSQEVAGNGIDFNLERPSQLKVAELVVSARDSGRAFVAVSGPGFVVPIEGTFTVTGNRLLQRADPCNGTNRLLPSDQHTVFSGEDILVIPRGQAVLWPVGHASVRLLLLAMVPTQPGPGDAERYSDPRGPESLEAMLKRLANEDGQTPTWFGAIQALAVAPHEVQPGRLSMDLTRIFVPAGETVRLSPRGYQLVALDRVDGARSEVDAFDMINTSNTMWFLETVRVCSHTPEHTPQRICDGEIAQP